MRRMESSPSVVFAISVTMTGGSLHFVSHEIKPTNNAAERALRMLVMLRRHRGFEQ